MRIRTWLSRACLTGAASLTVLALVAPPLAAKPGELPGAFRATAFAAPIHALLNTAPQTFVEELIRVDVTHGSATLGAGDEASARAASVFPGAAVEEGPGLAWSTFWGSFCDQTPDNDENEAFPCYEFPGLPPANPIPPWPLSAQAEHPTRPEAVPTVPAGQVGAPGDPMSFTVHEVKATATAETATSTAFVSNFDFLPLPGGASGVTGVAAQANPSLLHAGTVRSTTNLRFDDGVLVAEAESRLADVSLFGGAVQIEKLVATSSSRHDGGTTLSNDPRVTVEGVTVGGVPAKITHQGLVVGDGECVLASPQSGPLCGVPRAVAEGIERLFGGQIRLIDTTDDRREGAATGEAVAVMVSFNIDASGFPSGIGIVGDVMLGTANTTSFADASGLGEVDIDFGEEFFVEDDFGFEDDLGEFSDAGGFEDFAFVEGETIEDTGGTQAAPSRITGDGGRTVTRFAPLEALLSGVAADRIQLLYLAWTLTAVWLALGSRLRPFRFVGSR